MLELSSLIVHGVAWCTGEEAAAFLARGDVVDVMLLDIRMPGKTGLDAVRETKSLPNYPIVAMTGHVDTDAQQEFRYVFKLSGRQRPVPLSSCPWYRYS